MRLHAGQLFLQGAQPRFSTRSDAGRLGGPERIVFMRAAHCCVGLVLASCLLPLPSRAGSGKNGEQKPSAAKGEVLVKFREVSTEKLRGLALAHDLDRSHRLGGVHRLYRFHSRSKSTESLVHEFSLRGDVLYAEPNFAVEAVQQPNDPRFSELWACTIPVSHSAFPPALPAPTLACTRPGNYPPAAQIMWLRWSTPALTIRILICSRICGQRRRPFR